MLILGSRNPSVAVKQLQAIGAKVVGVAGDLADVTTAEALVREAEQLGRLDALLLNHGGPPVKPLLEITEEEWRRYFDLMVLGPLRLLSLSMPLFRRSGGGRVVAITSFTVKNPTRGLGFPTASGRPW